MSDGLAIIDGYARARQLTRLHSKSFYFSSIALFGARRRAAFALYAFCRRLDDLVDGDNAGDGSVAVVSSAPGSLALRLALARAAVSALYDGGVNGALQHQGLPWRPQELAAFHDTIERFHIPQEPFQELINGMEMDLTKSRYQTFDELSLYCYRAAGVVGLMMTHVLGFDDAACLPYAADLGIAMQLTNVLRDVKEDWHRGRLYLPLDELARFGLDERDIELFSSGDVAARHGSSKWVRWRELMAFQVARARGLYEQSNRGVSNLTGFGSRQVVRLMSGVYGSILNVVEHQQDDVFARRARVTTGGKVRIALNVLFTGHA